HHAHQRMFLIDGTAWIFQFVEVTDDLIEVHVLRSCHRSPSVCRDRRPRRTVYKPTRRGASLPKLSKLHAVPGQDLKPWQQEIVMLEADEMRPKKKPQPTAEERKQLVAWVRGFLDAEARGRAGDPGHVPLRRLSNTEYDSTIRDLTGVDLRPTREFPADGA